MGFRDDDRGQAIQVGAVLLFAILIIAFASYQAFVVPQQNREVEFNHNQKVHQQLQELRNAVVSMAGDSARRSVTVDLGTRYPTRAVAINPGPASGSLRTVETTNPRINVSVDNALGRGEVADFWDGSFHNYTTGAIAYQPNYNVYTQAPTTFYENSVLYNAFRASNVSLTGQALIDDERISVVTVNGTLDTGAAGATSVDVRPVSASTRTVAVTNPAPGENVVVAIPTRLSQSDWETLLSGELTGNGGHVVDVSPVAMPGSEFHLVEITLEAGVTYELQLTRVGVGSGVRDTSEAYLARISGDGEAVTVGGSQRLTVEVRDRFNNPVSGVQVNATASTGTVTMADDRSDAAGRVALTYVAPDAIGGGVAAVDVNVSLAAIPSGTFDSTTVENVSFSLSVQSTGGGADAPYEVVWQDPSGQSGTDAPCDDENCVFDASESDSITLTVGTDPLVDGATVEYAVSDSSVATVSPGSGPTDTNGEHQTTLTAQDNGTVDVYASSGADGDVITLTVEGVSSGGSLTATVSATATAGPGNSPNDVTVSWSADAPDGASLTSGTITVDDGSGTSTSTNISPSGNTDAGTETLSLRGDGTYTVTLTVNDDQGNTVTETTTASV